VSEPAAGWWGGDDVPDRQIREAMMAGASQDPWELWRVKVAVAMINPKVIVEIGCDRGGTLAIWRSLCDRVYGITLEDNSFETGGSGLPLQTHGAHVRIGNSHDPESRDWLISKLWDEPGGGVDVLVLDGDHSADGVWADLGSYGPLVRPGGLILLHDIRSQPLTVPVVEVCKVWPDLTDRYLTEQIINPDGGPGWGVIRVQPGDRF
jgi:cephalosporin hydroxylase